MMATRICLWVAVRCLAKMVAPQSYLLVNEAGKFVDKTLELAPDLLVGNLGLNIKYKASEKAPFKVYIKDFDDNGSNDIYLGYYDADGQCYPVRGREAQIAPTNGFLVHDWNKDVRALVMLKTTSAKPLIVIANNDSRVQVYE